MHHFGSQDVNSAALNRCGDHATKLRGSSSKLKCKTLFFYPQNPVCHSRDGLPGLGPCGEGLIVSSGRLPSRGLRLVIRGRGKVLSFLICLCFIFLAITAIDCVRQKNTSGDHCEQIEMFIIDFPKALLVLGHPWFLKHNSHIDWVNNSILVWSQSCHVSCLGAAFPTVSVSCVLQVHSPDLTGIPADYCDLRAVFSKLKPMSCIRLCIVVLEALTPAAVHSL